MEVPEKIYLNKNNKTLLDILSVKDTERIEYVRKDAFVKNACEWLEEHMIGWNNDFVKDFRNYMKGE